MDTHRAFERMYVIDGQRATFEEFDAWTARWVGAGHRPALTGTATPLSRAPATAQTSSPMPGAWARPGRRYCQRGQSYAIISWNRSKG